jgi:NADPH-dependent curcumin reductase CurA
VNAAPAIHQRSREIRLAAIPDGPPEEADFVLGEAEVAAPRENEVLVRAVFISIHPGMRSRMRDVTRPWGVGDVLSSPGIAQVLASRSPRFQPGDFVVSAMGFRLPWREVGAIPDVELQRIEDIGVPLSSHLGVLGHTGKVAYVGMVDIGQPKAGETVFVSAAAGAVGSVAGQIAKVHGCRVIGSAGTDEKAEILRNRLGFDYAFNYRKTSPADALDEAAPDGLDIYFDNVGADHLQAAVDRMRSFGRIVACGSVAAYNDDGRGPALHNLRRFVTHRLTMKGFVIFDHEDRAAAHFADMSKWVRQGRIENLETIYEGLDSAPCAFISMLRGDNIGRSLVRV